MNIEWTYSGASVHGKIDGELRILIVPGKKGMDVFVDGAIAARGVMDMAQAKGTGESAVMCLDLLKIKPEKKG